MSPMFSILTVCTGNICRSPLAEQLLRESVRPWPDIVVESAGTSALVGQPMTDQAQTLAVRAGVSDPTGHVARQLTIDLVRDADLIVALTREHRARIVELLPRASRRTFTVRELARLLVGVTGEELHDALTEGSADTAGRLAALVELAASRRGMVERADVPEDEDVVDPYRGDDALYERSAAQLTPAVSVIVRAFQSALAVPLP